MYLILYPFMALASVLLGVLTWLIAPILARFVDPATGNLPKYLYWFQTFDNTCFAGREPQYGFVGTDREAATYWLRRNPGYGFDYFPLGVAFDPAKWRVIRHDAFWFIALGPNGQFNIEHGGSFTLKLGWKAWNYYDATTGTFRTTPWGPEMRTSICCTP